MRHTGLRWRIKLGALLLAASQFIPVAAWAEPTATGAKTVSVAGTETRLETVVAILNQQTEARISLGRDAAGKRVSVLADDVPLEEALTKIAEPLSLVWWRDANGEYTIGSTNDRDHTGVNDPVWREHPEWVPPTPDHGTPKVNVAASETKIETIVQLLNEQIPKPIKLYGKIPGWRVSVLANGISLEDCLDTIAKPNGWVWWREKDGGYGLGDSEYYRVQVAGLPPSPPTPTPDPEIERRARERGRAMIQKEQKEREAREKALGIVSPGRNGAAPGRVTVAFDCGRIENLLAAVNSNQMERVYLNGNLAGTQVTANVKDVPMEDFLAELAKRYGWQYWRENNGDWGIGVRDFDAPPDTPIPLIRSAAADAATSAGMAPQLTESEMERGNRIRAHEGRIRAIIEERRRAAVEFEAKLKAGLVTPFPTPASGLPAGMNDQEWQKESFYKERAKAQLPIRSAAADAGSSPSMAPGSSGRDLPRAERLRLHESRLKAIIEERRQAAVAERRQAGAKFEEDLKAGLVTPFPTPATGLPAGMDEHEWQMESFYKELDANVKPSAAPTPAPKP